LAIQLVLAALVLAALGVAPPRQGKMLLVPLHHEAGSSLVAAAVTSGARLVDSGPFPGSAIVWGSRDRLVVPLARRGILVLAGPRAGCTAPSGELRRA
jgi:hypothetical protein